MYLFWIIAAGICFAYGILVMSVRSGSLFFLIWILLGAVCAALAAASRFSLWKSVPAAAKYLLAAAVIAGAVCFLFVEGKILSCFGERGEKDLDYLIVLGAQVHPDGPSAVLRYRLDAAEAYLRENPRTVCIVSGGQGQNEPFPEADGMRAYLLEKGISQDRILTERESRNTRENIGNSMVLFDPLNDRVGIVTNNFHVYRGCALARRAGIRNVCGIASSSDALFLPNNMVREFCGVLKDALQDFVLARGDTDMS